MKREVLEETGIETEFVSLICFRQLLNFRFGRSDLYFVCLLKPLSTEIKMDPKELQDAKWMDVSGKLNENWSSSRFNKGYDIYEIRNSAPYFSFLVSIDYLKNKIRVQSTLR